MLAVNGCYACPGKMRPDNVREQMRVTELENVQMKQIYGKKIRIEPHMYQKCWRNDEVMIKLFYY